MITDPQDLAVRLQDPEHRIQILSEFESTISQRMTSALQGDELEQFFALFTLELTVLRSLHPVADYEFFEAIRGRLLKLRQSLPERPEVRRTNSLLDDLEWDPFFAMTFFAESSSFWSRGRQWEDQGELDKAMLEYQLGRSWLLTPPLPQRYETKLADLENGIGNIYRSLRQLDRSLEAYQRGLALDLSGDPDTRGLLENNCGLTLRHLGRTEEAIEAFHRAIELWSEGPRDNDHLGWLSSAEGNLGVAYSQMGDRHRALARQRRDVALMEELYSQEPSIDTLNSLAGSFTNLGNELRAQGMLEEGLEANKRARDLLADTDLGDHDLRERLATFELNYANALSMMERHQDAVTGYRAAILIWRELASEGRPGMLLELGFTQSNLAMTFSDLEQPEKAVQFQKEALRNIEEANPRGRGRFHLGVAHRNLGYLHDLAGRFPQARDAYLRGREIWEEIVELQPSVHSELASLEGNLAYVQLDLEQPEQARKSLNKALAHLEILIHEQGRLDLKAQRTEFEQLLSELES